MIILLKDETSKIQMIIAYEISFGKEVLNRVRPLTK